MPTSHPGSFSDTAAFPEPANDNGGLLSPGQTPAEAFQKIRRIKRRMQKAFAADFTLRSDPRHRQLWDSLIEAEKCACWQFYHQQSD